MSLFSTNLSVNYDKLAYDFNFNDLDGTPIRLSESGETCPVKKS